jgi:hypothetical protein
MILLASHALAATLLASHGSIDARHNAPPGTSPRLHAVTGLDGVPITAARTGDRLLLHGTDLPEDGFLSVAQVRVIPVSRQPHYYAFVVPPASSIGPSGFIDLRRPGGTSYWGVFAGRLPGTFTIYPAPPPPPPVVYLGPELLGLQDALGSPLTTATAGDRVRAVGVGFGLSGRLWWGTTEVRTSLWRDGLIEFTVPPGLVPPRMLTIRRADGRYTRDKVLADKE